MSAIGRKCSVVNLDPANDSTSYPCAIDVRDLVKLEDIMEEDDLGPNGAVLYALEEVEQNMEWLEQGLSDLGEDYVLFDCPGQVELYTHHSSLRNIFFRLQKLGYRVCNQFYSSRGFSLVLTRFVACSSASVRFILPDSTFTIYLQPDIVPASYAADGSPASECPDEDR
jgi:GTPase SAR1 family protein